MVYTIRIRMAGATFLLALFAMVSAAFGQTGGCCITPIQDSVVSALRATQGVGNVTVQAGASCDSFELSWTAFDPGMGHYMPFGFKKYKLSGTDVEWSQTLQGVPSNGIMANWCQVSIEKGTFLPKSSMAFSAYPNPFQSRISFRFENSHGNALFQVFDAKGSKLHEETISGRSEVVWKPAHLRQGLYIARIKTPDRVFVRNVIFTK